MTGLVIAVDPIAGQRAFVCGGDRHAEEGGRDQYPGSCVCWRPKCGARHERGHPDVPKLLTAAVDEKLERAGI